MRSLAMSLFVARLTALIFFLLTIANTGNAGNQLTSATLVLESFQKMYDMAGGLKVDFATLEKRPGVERLSADMHRDVLRIRETDRTLIYTYTLQPRTLSCMEMLAGDGNGFIAHFRHGEVNSIARILPGAGHSATMVWWAHSDKPWRYSETCDKDGQTIREVRWDRSGQITRDQRDALHGECHQAGQAPQKSAAPSG